MNRHITGMEREPSDLAVDSRLADTLGQPVPADLPGLPGSTESSMKNTRKNIRQPYLKLTELIQLWLASQNLNTHPILKILHNESCTSADQKFLDKATVVIGERLSDPNFNTEALAAEMAVSRSQLFRKLVALTGNAPCEYVRLVRLLRAVKLIEQEFGNITEIAMAVGFNNPAYFAHCFRGHFGLSPSLYARNFGKN
ncbi:MAG: helix-turn-helix transcriptional regulator [bacterium]|nr:MAG: helix-turn-helix transcriptional regulator [bacterium]